MSATSANAEPTASLWAFIETLVAVDPKPTNADPPWFEPGDVCQIDERTYGYFLDMTPPRWLHGNWFASGEGAGPFRLFWKTQDAYFARELTEDETRTFCELSGVSLHV